MLNNASSEVPTGNIKFGNKQDVANMLGICRRSVDNLMARGLPHIKLTARTVRFNLEEVADWSKRTYSQQRIGKEGGL